MAETTYREIQLSVKQLVFAFMSAVALLLAAFLLGISVGRGVSDPAGLSAEGAAPSDTTVSTEAPPTEVGAGELTYHEDLQGRGRAGSALPPAPPPQAADPVTSPPTPPPTTAATPPATQTPPVSQQAPPPAQSQTSRPASPSPPPATADGAFALQLGAFSVRANADRLVAELKEKGFAAYIGRPSADSSLFAVRVGPFQTRAQAESMQDRLLRDPKGYKSSIVER